jgi:3',5'-cyclic-AMP phosphodiesterase
MSLETGRLTVLHVSDVHATDGELLYGSVDGLERLERVGAYAAAAGITPEAVIVTGDLVQRGHAGAYPALAVALARLEEAVGAPVVTVLGNHDDAAAAHVLAGHAEGHHRIRWIGGLRLALLDSSTGELGAAQLAWLREQLAEPAEHGTIVALHHAPLGSPLPTLAKQGLRDAAALLDALEGTDARLVLAGHFHHQLSAVVRGIPVAVAPALAYHQVMNAGPLAVSGYDEASFSLVHLTADGVSAASVSLREAEPIFTIPHVPNPNPAV